MFVLLLALCLYIPLADGQTQSTCQSSDFEFQYTECDELGQRWRVAVPKKPGQCQGGVPFPQRGKNCSFTCSKGKFLDLESQNCRDCAAGTYSLGGGVRFNQFDTLPKGFVIRNIPNADLTRKEGDKNMECPKNGGWLVEDSMLLYVPTPCMSVLSYSAQLVRPGKAEYVYRLPKSHSVYFTVDVQNAQCQSYSDLLRNMMTTAKDSETRRGSWIEDSVTLRSGQNVISWKVPGRHESDKSNNEPIIIARIDVIGLAYTEICTKCASGTFSSAGSNKCTVCKADTYSPTGSDSCLPCKEGSYSAPKASECVTRPKCKAADYYQTRGPCLKGYTELSYKWVEPRVCAGGTELPAATKQKCASCNPGMELSADGQCEYCKKEHKSDGEKCTACDPNTVPNYGYQLVQWNSMPKNMVARCQLVTEESDAECVGVDSWLAAGDRLHTAHTRQPGVALELTLVVAEGFSNALMNGEPSQQNPMGHVTFEFSTHCISEDCQFYFVEQSPEDTTNGMRFIGVWNGTVKRQPYVHAVTSKAPVRYIWAFLRSRALDTDIDNYIEEEASIYAINVTHTTDGGASACLPCPVQSPGSKGCTPCPSGHYMDESSRRCVSCPVDTMLNTSSSRVGVSSCIPCGPQLHSKDGKRCTSDGILQFEHNKYDIKKLAHKVYEASGVKVYGQEGTSYFHVFNVSLLDEHGATCTDTYNDLRGLPLLPQERTVSAAVCRATVLPLKDMNDTTVPVYVSPIPLGVRLLAISTGPSYKHIKLTEKELDSESKTPTDVHLFYGSDSSGTLNCPLGQSVVVTVRCSPLTKRTEVRLPRGCPDGTCDGCLYHILIESAVACPLCTAQDYQMIRGECTGGKQKIHYIPDKECVMSGKERSEKTVPCVVVSEQFQILIGISSALAIFLCCLVIVVCKRNRKLEYKYSKLINSSKGGDLPSAESCALDEDEDDEEDRVIFSRDKKKRNRLFGGRNVDEKRAFALDDEDSLQ